jgi:hypothetical protein
MPLTVTATAQEDPGMILGPWCEVRVLFEGFAQSKGRVQRLFAAGRVWWMIVTADIVAVGMDMVVVMFRVVQGWRIRSKKAS